MNHQAIRLGCEVLTDNPPPWLLSRRLGLLSNQASTNHAFEHVSNLIRKAGGNLCCLFSPQHGFDSEKQANMIESSDGWDPAFNIPVFSLYGDVRQPSPEMMEIIDVLLIDLQDVGARVYTYGITMGLCLEAAGRSGTGVVVLDRPNPINGRNLDGNILKDEYRSFVGRYPIPMRHGLTLGELARFIVKKCRLDCDLEVVPIEGWRRRHFFSDTDLPWVFPSPNMPSWETALLYPGMVLLEGTNVSEGRGTTLPFHLFGAPFIDQQALGRFLRQSGIQGVVFRPVTFEPAFDKWQNQACRGFQIHVTDRERLRPFELGLTLLAGLYRLHRDRFQWLPPPYEYEFEKLPIDILIGDGSLREKIERGSDVADLSTDWEGNLRAYREECKSSLLYPD